jgi:mono/diheme cytochrome c family protein
MLQAGGQRRREKAMKRIVVAAILGAAALSSNARAEMEKKTERLWKAKCASCHGADGKGETEQGRKLGVKDYTSAEWQKSKTDAQIKAAIVDGVKGMDGYKDKLAADQVDALVAGVRALK